MATATRTRVVRGGIDLGGTKIEAVVLDGCHSVLASARRPTPREGGPPDVAAALVEAIGEACATAGLEPSALTGVGVGSPGLVDPASGAVTGAANLPGWAGTFGLGEALAAALGAPVAVGNDVQVAIE